MAFRFPCLALALLCCGASAFAADSKAAGKWTLEGDVQGYPIHDVCTLTGTDDKLAGTCVMEEKERATTGTFDGTTLKLKHAGEYQGQDLTLLYTGKLQADGTITGGVYVDPMAVDGTFTATRGDKKADAK